MSKRDLRIYLKGLKKRQLEDQIIDLYSRFKEVKEFYDFAFNPKEDKLVEECKLKISKEYFPLSKRKPKMRRSVAQKNIKHFIQLGVDSSLVADIMLYNIEIAQAFTSNKMLKQDSFYQSMLKSFEEALKYIKEKGLMLDYKDRIKAIVLETITQDWINKSAWENMFFNITETD